MDPLKLEVKLDGEGKPTPESVHLNDLFTLLKKLQEAVGATATGRVVSDEDGGFWISLVGITSGSVCLTLGLPAAADMPINLMLGAIHSQNPAQLPLPARRALAEVSKLVERRKWEVHLKGDPKMPEADISPSNPFPDPDAYTVAGTTTVYGECLRAGGAKSPRVLIRPINTDKLLSAEVDSETARVLGGRLYKGVVGLEGVATWRLADWEMIGFRVTRVLDYQDEQNAPLTQAFQELSAATSGVLDHLDIPRHLAEVFGEEDEE